MFVGVQCFACSIGITVVRANGQPLHACPKVWGGCETANVNLIQVTTLPGLNGCYAKARIDITGLGGACLLFEPNHKGLGDSDI